MAGRNDGYGGDFTTRYARALRFNHERLAEVGIAHEIVLVEWNPVPDEPRLAELLAQTLPETARNVTRYYVVDHRYHDALTQNPRLGFLDYVAKNVGIRRATGSFVLATNPDVLVGLHVFDVIGRGQLE